MMMNRIEDNSPPSQATKKPVIQIGSLKILALPFFTAGMLFSCPLGDSLKTRSLQDVREHPILISGAVLAQGLAVWGLIYLKGALKNVPTTKADGSPLGITDVDPNNISDKRISFLLGIVANILGLVCGFWLMWARYQR